MMTLYNKQERSRQLADEVAAFLKQGQITHYNATFKSRYDSKEEIRQKYRKLREQAVSKGKSTYLGRICPCCDNNKRYVADDRCVTCVTRAEKRKQEQMAPYTLNVPTVKRQKTKPYTVAEPCPICGGYTRRADNQQCYHCNLRDDGKRNWINKRLGHGIANGKTRHEIDQLYKQARIKEEYLRLQALAKGEHLFRSNLKCLQCGSEWRIVKTNNCEICKRKAIEAAAETKRAKKNKAS